MFVEDLSPSLALSQRFGVLFIANGTVPNPLDIRFQRVSGLESKVDLLSVREGGENRYTHQLPNGITHENLILERGAVVGSPLNVEFTLAMSLYRFTPSNVIVTVLNDQMLPLMAWMFFKAIPVGWKTSDLDANSNSFVIDTLELSYTRMQPIRM